MTSRITTDIAAYLKEDRNAVLATVKVDGAAQLTPVWYLYDEGQFYVSALISTAKVRNLRRNPAVTLCIDGGRDRACYVVIYGTAGLVEPQEPLQTETRRRIIRHYHSSEEAADLYYESVKNNPAALIVITPERVVAQGF